MTKNFSQVYEWVSIPSLIDVSLKQKHKTEDN